MKYEQQIFNPPRMSQGNILHEAKISETQLKIKNIYAFAGQLKAHGLTDFYEKQIKEAELQELKLKSLLMAPEALAIPREIFHGK